ncbi:MAG TPA: DUF3306 domain-containing protein [Burkholderiaceae bacterium]|nr:DUF3306 domain-containing protein [Burkholderiaceae bacterium]
MSAEEGFFSRWSRRKAQVTRGEAPPEPEQTPPAPAAATPSQAAAPPVAGAAVPQAVAPAPAEPPPTLEDVERLTPESDFSRFAQKDVDENVRRAAFKKLFSDPHFNEMDGLDVYIDDYSKPDPIPPTVLRKMVQSQLLGLFRDEERPPAEDRTPTAASADGVASQDVPQSQIPDETTPGDVPGSAVPHDENAAVQLQPDHAARRPGPEPGPGVG